MLAAKGMLPAIWFIFSRRDCDQSAQQLDGKGVTLTTAEGESCVIMPRAISHMGLMDLTRECQQLDGKGATLTCLRASHALGPLVIPWVPGTCACVRRSAPRQGRHADHARG